MIMKGAGLLVGLGIGVLIGAAFGAYLVASEEDKAKWKNDVNSTVEKAKQKINKVLDENLTGWSKSSI
jgi:gas vesicle protein